MILQDLTSAEAGGLLDVLGHVENEILAKRNVFNSERRAYGFASFLEKALGEPWDVDIYDKLATLMPEEEK